MNSKIYFSDYNYDYNTYRSSLKRKSIKTLENVWQSKENKVELNLNKFNLKLTIETCILSCFLCFIYQSYQLFSEYMSGKTIVENRVQRFKYSQLSAFV